MSDPTRDTDDTEAPEDANVDAESQDDEAKEDVEGHRVRSW